MCVAAVVPAAGRGERLGGEVPKAFRLLGGAPLLVHAVDALRASRHVRLVVVAAPADRLAEVTARLGPAVVALPGGASRQESVAAAMAALPSDVDVVLVHDAARPLVPLSVVDAVAEAGLAGAPAGVPVLPGGGTPERGGRRRRGGGTGARADLRAVQTPQGFHREVLVKAHAAADPRDPVTDDAGLVERLGIPVATVPGSTDALKITTPFDLVVAEAILRGRA